MIRDIHDLDQVVGGRSHRHVICVENGRGDDRSVRCGRDQEKITLLKRVIDPVDPGRAVECSVLRNEEVGMRGLGCFAKMETAPNLFPLGLQVT